MANFHELIERFHNFKEEYFLKEREFFHELTHGQNPKTLVIACCDSRVDPAILMGCRPGDLFVVRSVAALLPEKDQVPFPDAVLAAVEYGVKHLKVDHIIVMGHSHCGGITGLLNLNHLQHERYIRDWVCLAKPVLDELKAEHPDADPRDLQRLCEEGTVLLSIDNLLSFDWIKSRVDAGTLSLHALYYDMSEGSLLIWNAEKEDFEHSTIFAS